MYLYQFIILNPLCVTIRVGKKITPKDIPSGTGEPAKETRDTLEDENDKQVRMITGGPLKKKDMLRDENVKQVRTST